MWVPMEELIIHQWKIRDVRSSRRMECLIEPTHFSLFDFSKTIHKNV